MAIRKPGYNRAHYSEQLSPAEDSAMLREWEKHLPDIVRHHTRGLLRQRVTVRGDGTLSIPAELRRVLALEPGAEIELEITTGGCLLIHPNPDVDPEQWWYRTRQFAPPDPGEVRPGRIYLSTEEFLAALGDPDH